MKPYAWGLAALLVAVVVAVALNQRAESPDRTSREDSPPDPVAAAEPERADPELAEFEDVLGLKGFDPEKGPFAVRGEGFQRKRSVEAMTRDYLNERKLRLRLAENLLNLIAPELKLTSKQATALEKAVIQRGDTVRIAFYREHTGAMSREALHAAQGEAEKAFDEDLVKILNPDQHGAFRRIEEAAEFKGKDLGFGVLYGIGEGGGRPELELPERNQ